jgi:hypothetical protein
MGLVLMLHVSCHHRCRDKKSEMGRLLQLHHVVHRTPGVQGCNVDYCVVESAQNPEIEIRDGQVQTPEPLRQVRIDPNSSPLNMSMHPFAKAVRRSPIGCLDYFFIKKVFDRFPVNQSRGALCCFLPQASGATPYSQPYIQ